MSEKLPKRGVGSGCGGLGGGGGCLRSLGLRSRRASFFLRHLVGCSSAAGAERGWHGHAA